MKKLSIVYIYMLCFIGSIQSQEPSKFIHLDQFGYLIGAEKYAVISNPQIGYNRSEAFSPSILLEVREVSTDKIVYSASPSVWNNGAIHEQSGDKGWWFDMSSLTTPGSYYVYDPDSKQRSAIFEISDNPYSEVLKAAMKMFYYNRCNLPKVEPYAGSKWVDGNNFAQDFKVRNAYDQDNPATERDMSGGWFDAGDYNKYVTFAHDPIHQLLSSYEENSSIYLDDLNIPESGDGIPDILNEIQYELDWMRKMINRDGSVYIKMGSLDYDINDDSPPSQNAEPRYYGTICSSAALSVASSFSHAALVFKSVNELEPYSKLLEKDAELCWDYFFPFYSSSNLETDCDDQTVKAGDADWDEISQINNAIIAAIYLYDLTDKQKYADFIEKSYLLVEPIVNDFIGPNQAVLLEALLHYTQLNGSDVTVVDKILKTSIDAINNNWGNYFDFNEDDLYRAGSPDWIYYWGSNMGKANIGNLCHIMKKFNVLPRVNDGLTRKANEQLHYFHGVNPQGMIYLSNMYAFGGDRCANQIFHTWFQEGTDWDDALISKFGPAPGFLSGGPNQGYTGKLSPPANQPLQKCYLDYNDGYNDVAYEITEPAIYYQAAYIRFLANYINTKTTKSSPINKNNNFVFDISPNPSNDFITIKGNLDGVQVLFIDLNGTVIKSQNLTGTIQTLNISDIPQGIFIVQLMDKNKSVIAVRKLVK